MKAVNWASDGFNETRAAVMGGEERHYRRPIPWSSDEG
jgi:hypothetical protein